MMLLIRNMESARCKTIVREELNKLGLLFKSVEIGEVELSNQFKKVTGVTPFNFRQLGDKNTGNSVVSEKH